MASKPSSLARTQKQLHRGRLDVDNATLPLEEIVRVEVKITGAEGILRTLQSLPSELVSKQGGPVKLALMKGARLLRDKARANLSASMVNDDDYQNTNLLVSNVIASRGKAPSGGKGERALVRVKRKAYPKKGGETVTTRKTASLKEYGSSHQPATPWLRPAVQSNGQQVIDVVVSDLSARLDRLVKKLAAQNKGR